MIFWDVYQTALSLKMGRLTWLYCLVSVSFLFITSALHINIPSLLPFLYVHSFEIIKNYLEYQVAPASLIIMVYPLAEWIILSNYFLFGIGSIFLMLMHDAPILKSIKHVLCLLMPVTFRLIIISSVLFFIGLFCAGGYFAYKLLALSKEVGPKGPIFLRPLKYVFKMIGSYDAIKDMWAKLFRLPKAQIIFKEINQISHCAFLVTHVLSTISVLWALLKMRRGLKLIEK